MKKNKRLFIGFLGIIAVAAIMGFSLTACGDTSGENPNNQTEYCQINWELNGGEWETGYTPPAQVEKGKTLSRPTAPAKDGYTFDKWYSNAGLTSAYVFSRTVTGDLTLYAGWTAPPEPTYLLFTSDVHWRDSAKGIFDTWMPKMVSNIPTGVEYMSWHGDHAGSNNNEASSRHWINADIIMKKANAYVDDGFIKNKNIYIFGNHEWNIPSSSVHGGDYTNDHDSWAAQQLEANHTKFEHDTYVIYVLGAIYTPPPGDGCLQQFAQSEIDTLGEYLEGTTSKVPLFIIAHHPLHSINLNGRARFTEGSPDNLITLLNEYSAQRDIYFLWGHNHSQNPTRDPHYDTIYPPGSQIEVLPGGKTASWGNVENQEIQFTYMAAGCLSDVEYTGGSELVLGKAVLAVITNGEVAFTYYDKDATAFAPTVTGTWNAGLPTISAQPVGRTYTQSSSGGTVTVTPAKVNLSVTAALPAGETPAGTLSYQWYYSTVSESDPGTAIPNTASSTYDLANLDLTAPASVGTHYYYVKVTNTNSAATGVTTASRDSNRAVITVAEGAPPAPLGGGTYVITGSGASFTATFASTSETVKTGTIAEVIAEIREQANGQAVTIQFGNGTTTLNIGDATVALNNTGGAWGKITLTGDLTAANTETAQGAVTITTDVSVTITAKITDNGSTNTSNKAVYVNTTGTTAGTAVEIADGAVITANAGNALFVTTADNNSAANGTVLISGGTLTSANSANSATSGTTCCAFNASLTITGGTITNTNGSGYGVYMAIDGGGNDGGVDATLTITGGTITVAGPRAISIVPVNNTFYLRGAGPTITNNKLVYRSRASLLSVEGPPTFNPGQKVYTLSFSSSTGPSAGFVVVKGGAAFSTNFTGDSGLTIGVSGNDLVKQ